MKHKLRKLMTPFESFLTWEAGSGVILLASAIVALVLANSPFGASYEHVLHTPLGIGTGGYRLEMSLAHWVNDGLMTVFFFVIGLEIKREFLYGELRTKSAMLLPVCAALGGMIMPALLYSLMNLGAPTAGGWGIPMATDIAFALGIMTLAAGHAPVGLVVFLTALAIVDDLGAIVVIALFYSSDVSLVALGAGLACIAGAFVLNKFRVQFLPAYLACGLGAWLAFLASGIHPTIAGVLLGTAIPATAALDDDVLHDAAHPMHGHHGSLLHKLETALEPWSAYVIMPIFALANAGVNVAGANLDVSSPLFLGIAAGLIVGKPLGIYGSVRLLTKFTGAPLPGNAKPMEALSAGALGGIGFTMSIFIATLAFPDEATLAAAKLSILISSVLAGVLGAVMFQLTKKGRD
ncbi:Na+/H+ antiporter NhaA [uncultured Selenomonas sp.]|uniref:Na+/H+ antiporter NhaA n=1 Tax=uncultured Selenomonas sp. TaxID=159275 RepID=UPI002600DBE0|nr:Na+/H+ antiporter NhaA [uncultured Selenomonas sp.]